MPSAYHSVRRMVGKLISVLALVYLVVNPVLGATGPGPRRSHFRAQAHLTSSQGPPPPQERYVGHQVYRVDWRNLDEGVKAEILLAIELLNLDVWRSTPSALDVSLHFTKVDLLRNLLPSTIPLSVFIPDLQSLIDLSTPQPLSGLDAWDLSVIDTSFHDAYHPYSKMLEFGDALMDEFPTMVESFAVGNSYEGVEIEGWRVHLASNESISGIQSGEEGRKRKKVKGKKGKVVGQEVLEFVVQSGQHAREWVGPSTALYFLHALLVGAREEPWGEIAKLLRAFTFTIVPTINPDGYQFSQTHSRLWRKNRQDVGGGHCSGIDLNSNWGYKWRPGRSTSACSDSYPGKTAFEAFETRAMANYLANGTTWCPDCSDIDEGKREGRRVRAFVDLHSYGQLFMFPFAHSCDDFPPDAEMLMEAGLGVAKAMRTRQGEGYQAGQACDLTYRAPGDAIDFSYGVTDVQWSYSAELRDTGTHGFLLPPHLIRPTAEEVTAGLLYLAKFIYNIEIAG